MPVVIISSGTDNLIKDINTKHERMSCLCGDMLFIKENIKRLKKNTKNTRRGIKTFIKYDNPNIDLCEMMKHNDNIISKNIHLISLFEEMLNNKEEEYQQIINSI